MAAALIRPDVFGSGPKGGRCQSRFAGRTLAWAGFLFIFARFPGDATSGFSSEMRISFKAEKPGVVTQVSRVSLILHILSFS